MKMALIATASALLVQCGGTAQNEDSATPSDQATVRNEEVSKTSSPPPAIIEERQTMAEELKSLRAGVEERLVDVNNRLGRQDLSKETRDAVEDEREALNDLRKRIDKSLTEIEGSDESTWQEIKEGAKNTTADVKAWFKKMADKVDQETKADKDNDGH